MGEVLEVVRALRRLCPCGKDHPPEELHSCACGTCTRERWPLCGDNYQVLFDFEACPKCGATQRVWTRHNLKVCERVLRESCCEGGS
jgi:hypothetical protein